MTFMPKDRAIKVRMTLVLKGKAEGNYILYFTM